jgi:3-(3-hydroxy-phenyl)propionate hydroxylase
MLNAYDYPEFEFHQSADQKSGAVKRHPVVVAGGGPVGLSAAIDLAVRGLKVVGWDAPTRWSTRG